MPTPITAKIEAALRNVNDQQSFIHDLLIDALNWPVPDEAAAIEDMAYSWSAKDLRGNGLGDYVKDGSIWQIQPLQPDDVWGIFVLEFQNEKIFTTGRGLAGPLRQVLRGLVPSRRQQQHLPAWDRSHLLFICTHAYRHFRLAYFKAPPEKEKSAPLATFGWGPDIPARTAIQLNLPPLSWPDAGLDSAAWVSKWAAAFDVEAVTRRFFADYRQVFEAVEHTATGLPNDEQRRLYTQRLFNRLMFLYFIQKKGWLSFEGDKDYLRALFTAAEKAGESFLNDRLYWAFFHGLNTIAEDKEVHAAPELTERRGQVPFLNGGLFDLEDEYDVQGKVAIPNAAFGGVLDLFEHYNFTVTESTPLDIEVAVDPEMLGKVFEELVTGRHETGSYYTPRPIVAFMCQEAIKHYLTPHIPDADALAPFVYEGDAGQLPNPEPVLDALRAVKVCDPACGSGAYLLGMMHELLRLREALFATNRKLDKRTVYERKLEIIENNLYGVDIDPFAVNIAKLRLWLSLAIDFEGEQPPPLPNLDFKIEQGDSLTAPDPQELPDLFRQHVVDCADEIAELKGKYLRTQGKQKKKLREKILAMERKLKNDLHGSPDGSVDWRVAFAEVFRNGGFDIALENPPYVRMELFKHLKPVFKQNFPFVYDAGADLYVYFYARTHQLLRPGGTACVISSNKWLKAGYGEPLRRFFADSTWVATVVDFGHAKQIFQNADVFPSILVVCKPSTHLAPPTSRVCAIPRERLRLEDLQTQVKSEGFETAHERLSSQVWTLEPPGVVALLNKLRASGVPLRSYAAIDPLSGIKTGYNEAFLIDTKSKQQLLSADPKSAGIFKPYLRGQDVSRWHPEWAGLWMLALKSSGNHDWPWSQSGKRAESVFAATYPALHAHLNQYRDALINRQDQGEHWWELRACAYWDRFDEPKIIYPEITWRSEWCYDEQKLLINNTVYILPVADHWILAVANSPLMWWYSWRTAVHGKDEALRFIREFVQELPICSPTNGQRAAANEIVTQLIGITKRIQESRRSVLDWLRVEFNIEKPSQKLQDVPVLSKESLQTEVQKQRGKKQPLSAAQVKALQVEHARSIKPLQQLAAEAKILESRVADLVNEAYGLTPQEVALMWATAPPRMPGERPS